MGNGYWILVWDGFGAGLVLINPRMHTTDKDFYGNPRNWWPCDVGTTVDEIATKHKLFDVYGEFFRVILD